MTDEITADVLIVGAGIMGLTIARELVRNGWQNIVIIEKETETGKHASGRNSGVLHAGIYYAPDSLKAKSCLNGNFLMKAYCREKQLPLLETGKVIVARSADELPVLETLFARAVANGAKVDMLNEKELAAIEPNARTVRQAIFSHYTAVVDPRKILNSLQDDLVRSGNVKFLFNCAFETAIGSHTVQTQCGRIRFKRFINAAGAHCDRVSKAFGIGTRYRLIPFKGIYRKLKKDSAWRIRGSIYPVPDIRNPFLGVHFTRNIHGDVYLGPTAIPAFGRENYGIFAGLDKEAIDILLSDAHLFTTNSQFRTVALTEPRKYFFPWFFQDAAALVKTLEPSDVEPAAKVGIRAQLVDWRTGELVQDFQVIQDGDCLHLLNPISPAFTSSMDLAQKIVRMIQ
jgi:L-2-hydroxyglutarate oxidase LhgO